MAGLHPAGMFIALDMFSADLHEESDPAAAAQAGDGSDDSEAFERQQAAVPNPPAPKRQQIALEPEEEIDVELQQQTEKALSARMKQVFDRASTPTLLAGEVTISSAEFVEGFNTCSLESGVSGSLFVTNYRMAFVATEGSSYTHGTGASSTFDENDVPLTCIVRIYKIINGKRTRLDAMLPESSAALNAIEVRCKDWRQFKFVFANTPRFQAIRLVNALFHYAFPTSASRLFAFDYRPPVDVYEEVVKVRHSLVRSSTNTVAGDQSISPQDLRRVTDACIRALVPDSAVTPPSELEGASSGNTPAPSSTHQATVRRSHSSGASFVLSTAIPEDESSGHSSDTESAPGSSLALDTLGTASGGGTFGTKRKKAAKRSSLASRFPGRSRSSSTLQEPEPPSPEAVKLTQRVKLSGIGSSSPSLSVGEATHQRKLSERSETGDLNPALVPYYQRRLFELAWEVHRCHADRDLLWRISRANVDFSVCDTLPPFLCVPAAITDAQLAAAALRFQDGRIPTWCWSSPLTMATLTRSALPLPPPGAASNTAVSGTAPISSQSLSALSANDDLVVYMSAMAIASSGPHTIVNVSSSVPTHAALRDSFLHLQELCMGVTPKTFLTSDRSWLSSLEGAKWISHVEQTLTTASNVADLLHVKHTSVTVQGEHPRDSGCLIASLVKILVDPFYRTIAGFELLIEHEWVAYGHPFSTRCGHITRQAADESEGASSPAPGTESWAKKPSWLPLTPNSAPSDADHAPYFLLFLDCVHQIMTQYPLSFEMTEKYLITLCDAMWACLFGTFVSNSDKDRVDSSMESRTVPVWAHMHIVLEQDGVDMEFLNPAFVGPQSLPASSHSQPASTMINAMNGMFELMPDLHIEVTPPATAAAAASSVSSTAPSGKHARVEESFITPPPMPYVQRCPITSHTDASVGAPLALTPQGEGLLLNFWDVNYLRWVPHVRPAFVDVAFTSALYHTRELVHEVAQLERQRQRLQRLLAERTTAV